MIRSLSAAWARVSLAGTVAHIATLTMAAAVVGHATKDIWWPYCKPDQVIIGPASVAKRLQTAEARLADGDRYEVTTFVTVPGGLLDGLEVTTGTKFSSMSASAPERSYCYASLPGQRSQAVVDLADRLGWGSVRYVTIDDERARFVRRTADQLHQLAKTACRWMPEKAS